MHWDEELGPAPLFGVTPNMCPIRFPHLCRRFCGSARLSLGISVGLVLMTCLSGCGTTAPGGKPGIAFYKVNDYHLRDEPGWQDEKGGDPMVPFERKRLLYGAVTEKERQSRSGNYYTFFWTDTPSTDPATIRFEYRQAGSGAKVHRREQEVPRVSARNLIKVKVLGDEYRQNGRVVAWRVSLWRHGENLASTQSFLW